MSMQATTTAPLFSAKLTPHHSLSPRGMRIVIALVAGLAALPGIIFFAMGAWPVLGFMGLDVIGIAWALSASRKGHARQLVTLWSDRLTVVTTDMRGTETTNNYQPRAVRLLIDRDFDERTTALRLRSAQGELELGAFLSLDERSSFAKAFGSALRKARG